MYLCQAGGRKGKKKVCVNTLILNCQTVCLTVKLSLTLFQTTNLDAPTLKEFVDDNFRIDENGGKFYKRVENAVGKGEIAPQCFQKTCTVNT